MHIKQLKLEGFMNLSATDLSFPDRGVVVVTGANGEGKSSLIEAVSFGGWGETLRGTDPWMGADGSLCLRVDDGNEEDLLIEVSRKKGKDSLRFRREGGEVVKFATPTKAREALASILGPWDVWRRSSAFSTSDVAHYSLATDGEQKRLVEGVLGLEVFDSALKSCRNDLTQAQVDQRQLSAGILGKWSLLEEKRRYLAEQEILASVQPKNLDHLADHKRSLSSSIKQIREDLNDLRAKMTVADEGLGGLAAIVQHIKAAIDRIASEQCPTCTQPIPKKLRVKLADEVAKAEAERREKATEVVEIKKSLTAQIEELEEDYTAIQAKLRSVEADYGTASAEAAHIRHAQEACGRIRVEIKELERVLCENEERSEQLDEEVGILKATESVLGLRGVRAHVLAKALTGLDSVANAWLARIAGPSLRIKIQAFTETKTAGVSDKFSLTVEGAGNGKGYKAASQGQRRRIDVALLFALSEIAAAARGVRPGTLFVDEVFDILDAAGEASVCAAIRELAESRCVVVITHSMDLAKALRPVRRWHILQGTITET